MIRKIKKSAPDTRSIDIDDIYTLDYWAREFGVSRSKLKDAVLIAGTDALSVKRELIKPKVI